MPRKPKQKITVDEISLEEFFIHFCSDTREDRKCCFILGSGASRPSGIPTGGELAKQWIDELNDKYGKKNITAWMQKEKISPDRLAEAYTKIYVKRFRFDKKMGYLSLEKMMSRKDPSCRYSYLAQIMATTPNNIVITTNFDSMSEDALFIYTQEKPLVVGHEALAGYINLFGSRPTVVKIHRDLLLSPESTDDGTRELKGSFKKNLEGVFKYFTPLVIGYGGNDGSLMGFLEGLTEVEGGIFWFYRKADGELNDRIKNVIKQFRGFAVPIPGFDELMVQLGDSLGLKRLDDNVVDIAKKRASKYKEQFNKIMKETGDSNTKDALSGIVGRGEKDWWYYEVEASREKDINKREKIYKAGIEELPDSPELSGNYALFLNDIRNDYSRAEEMYKKAIELDPNNATNLGNYAVFLYNIRKDYDKAEALYEKAIELDPSHANNFGNYALFFHDIRKDYDRAEELYKKAVELDPNHANNLGNYAIFLNNVCKDYNNAEEFYKRAIEMDPTDANILGNYSKCLIEKHNLTDARRYIKKAFELNKSERKELDLELWFYCYAAFFDEYKNAKKKIEELLNDGIKSPEWYLDEVLAVAKELKHPNYDKLCGYAKRITAID
ncbi:MAG: tetratricopeptide repeat protein [Candidatus Zixiibacteriota bacterium]